MKKYQIIKGDSINLGELSKYNGKSKFENTKMIILLLAQKAEAYGITQTIRLTYRGDSNGQVSDNIC